MQTEVLAFEGCWSSKMDRQRKTQGLRVCYKEGDLSGRPIFIHLHCWEVLPVLDSKVIASGV